MTFASTPVVVAIGAAVSRCPTRADRIPMAHMFLERLPAACPGGESGCAAAHQLVVAVTAHLLANAVLQWVMSVRASVVDTSIWDSGKKLFVRDRQVGTHGGRGQNALPTVFVSRCNNPPRCQRTPRTRMTDLTSVTRHLTCLNRLPRQRCAKKTSRGGKTGYQQGFALAGNNPLKIRTQGILKRPPTAPANGRF